VAWESIKQLASDLGLGVDHRDVMAVEAALREQLLELHPDRTGGRFPNQESEARYHLVSEALRYLESRFPIPVELAGIAKRLDRLDQALARLAPSGPTDVAAGSGIRKSRERIRADATARYRTSRRRTTVFATAAGAIVAFSKILPGNPLFGWIAASPIALAVLGILFVSFGGLSVINWVKQDRVQRNATWLLGEEGLGYLVRECLRNTARDEAEAVITRRGLAQQVIWFRRPWDKRAWLGRLKQQLIGGIPVAVAEEIADLQLGELLRRGVVRQHGFRGIEPVFRMEPDRVKELLDDHFYYMENY
jgi:hypothetical protein